VKPLKLTLFITLAWLTITPSAANVVAALEFYLGCDRDTPQSQWLLLPYWSKGVARGAPTPGPACVERLPALSGLPLKSTLVSPAPHGSSAIVELEFGEDARSRMTALSTRAFNRFLALVVNGRVVAMPYVNGQLSNKVTLAASSREEAEEIVAAIARVTRQDAPPSGSAQFYRCIDKDGEVSFTDKPCRDASSKRSR
jgi:Domain of unknown function (DUF4124)